MNLHLTCAFEVIILPTEGVIVVFHHFFLQFMHIVEMGQKAHSTITSLAFHKYLLLLICSLVDLSNNNQKVRQGMAKN